MGLAHITLATRDVRRSADFFREVLGWQPVARPRNITPGAAWLAMSPDVELHLIEESEFEPSPFEHEFGRHIALTYRRAEFSQLKARLEANGATLIEPVRETPFERFFFRDRTAMSSKSSRKITTSPGR